MLKFRPLRLSDREEILRLTGENRFRGCESGFMVRYIWRHRNINEICFEGPFVFERVRLRGRKTYFLPRGGDLREGVERIRRQAEEEQVPFSMVALPEPAKDELEQAMPGVFEYTTNRNDNDYLYKASDLIGLEGKKYHAKRNYLNRFRQAYEGRWGYEEIGDKNIADVWDFQQEWCRKNQCDSNISLIQEETAIAIALDNLDRLGASAGLLRLDGKVIAFTAGSPICPDTYGVQIEKADADIPGAYAMINWEFARRNCTAYEYINREEDMGIEGLRRAKLSYHPVDFVRKFAAVPKEGV